MGLKQPGRLDRVLHGPVICSVEIGDNHHVLGESGRHREDLRMLVKQCVPNVERHPHHHVCRIELAGNQPALELPASETGLRPAPDTRERSGQLVERVQIHAAQCCTRQQRTAGRRIDGWYAGASSALR